MFDSKTKLGLLTLLNLISNSVNTMSANIEGLVESPNDIGVLLQMIMRLLLAVH